jgi:hypothetical protein
MCNCGKMKTNLNHASNSEVHGTVGGPVFDNTIHGTVSFEYVGRSTLTAIGPVTGRRYRFGAPGARVAVDVRDRPSLVSVPHLRQLRS